MLLEHLLKTPSYPLNIHQELANPPGQPGQLLLARIGAHIFLVNNLEGDISHPTAPLNKTHGIITLLLVLHLHNVLVLDPEASLMPHLLHIVVVEHHVHIVYVVVVVKVEQF